MNTTIDALTLAEATEAAFTSVLLDGPAKEKAIIVCDAIEAGMPVDEALELSGFSSAVRTGHCPDGRFAAAMTEWFFPAADARAALIAGRAA